MYDDVEKLDREFTALGATIVVDIIAKGTGSGSEMPINGFYLEEAAPDVPADFDNDGDVDGADFLKWQQGYPMSSGATKADGDADGDGDVDGQDFLIWQQWYPHP